MLECKADLSSIDLPEEPRADKTDEKAPETESKELLECKADLSSIDIPEEPIDPNEDKILITPKQEEVSAYMLQKKEYFKHIEEFYMPALEGRTSDYESKEETEK